MSSGSQPSSISSYSDSGVAPAARPSVTGDTSARHICRCSLRLNNSEKVSHEQFAKLAEAELSAYRRAMSEQFGNAFAEAATEQWFRAFAGVEIDKANPRRSLRRATINAIANALAD